MIHVDHRRPEKDDGPTKKENHLGSVPAAEAKKADDASMDTLRTPIPLTKPEGWPDSTDIIIVLMI